MFLWMFFCCILCVPEEEPAEEEWEEDEEAEEGWEEEEEDWEVETEEEPEEEPEDEQEEEQEEEKEEDYQTKGMYAVALVKTCVSLITNYSFTVYRWMEKTTTKNWKLKRNLDVEEKVEYETKCTSTIEHL